MRNMYELWMDQSSEFFTTADEHLKKLFSQSTATNPDDHAEAINVWLNAMKQSWEKNKSEQEQKEYWQTMTKICNDAADLMMKEWVRLSRTGKPVSSIHELYQLWMSCCGEVNKGFNFWK